MEGINRHNYVGDRGNLVLCGKKTTLPPHLFMDSLIFLLGIFCSSTTNAVEGLNASGPKFFR